MDSSKNYGTGRKVVVSLLLFLLAFSLACFLFTVQVRASGITLVQSAGNSLVGTGSSFNVTLSPAPVQGHYLILTFAGVGSTVDTTVSSIAQTGVTWLRAQNVTNWDEWSNAEIWMGTVSSGAGTIVTVNINGGSQSNAISIADVCEWSGLNGVVDQTAQDSTSGTFFDTGTTSTTLQANELCVGVVAPYAYSTSVTCSNPTNGFTLYDGVTVTGSRYTLANAYLYKVVSATGTYSSAVTPVTQHDGVGCIATFKAFSPQTIHVPEDYPTVQAAVNNAQPGDTILVHEGVYSESVNVGIPLTIKAEGKVKVIPPALSPIGFNVTSDGVTIEGFEVAETNYGISFEGSSDEFTHNYIHDVSCWGIALINKELKCSNDEIDHNEISNVTANWGIGILVDSRGSCLQTENNRIDDNTIDSAADSGIMVLSSNDLVISHNEVNESGNVGIYISSSTGITIDHNKLYDNYRDGIYVESSHALTVDHNDASHNNRASDPASPYGGIFILQSDNIVAENNEANDNGRGIAVFKSTSGSFTHNSAHGNTAVDLFWDNSGKMAFKSNHCDTANPSKTVWAAK